jgi:hypothetical protein
MKYSVCLLATLFAVGCTDAGRSKLGAYGAKHHIELWSGGQKVHEWTSTGKVLSETESDGYYFRDQSSGALVRVTGDLVITSIE